MFQVESGAAMLFYGSEKRAKSLTLFHNFTDKEDMASAKLRALWRCFALLLVLLPGCGQTTGNVILFTQNLFSNTSTGLVGLFYGTIGSTTASTGTCSASGAQSGFCTGGSFASGAGDGMMSGAYSIAVDSTSGFSYYADVSNNRIVKFNTSTGAFVGALGNTTASSGTCPASGATNAFCTGGTFASGAGDGMFYYPQGVAVDSTNGFLYVAESGNNRVQKFILSSGVFVGAIGYTIASTGTCPASGAASGWCTGGTFHQNNVTDGAYSPFNLAIDVAGDKMYIVDYLGSIHKVTLSTGAFIGSIGYTSSSVGTCPSGETNGWCTGGTFTTNYYDGGFSFSLQAGIALDTVHDYFYVSDDFRHMVMRFVLSTGVFAGAIGEGQAPSVGTCPTSGAASGWCTGGDFQCDYIDGTFCHPSSVVVDATNNVLYVGGDAKISKLNLTTGAFIGAIGLTSASSGSCSASVITTSWCTGGTFTSGTADGAYARVTGLALDPSTGNLLAGDGFTSRLIKIK